MASPAAAGLTVRRNFIGLVIGNQGDHFSAGANLKQLLVPIEAKQWDEIGRVIHAFQQAATTLRQFEKPVVVATHGYTLGGGDFRTTPFSTTARKTSATLQAWAKQPRG